MSAEIVVATDADRLAEQAARLIVASAAAAIAARGQFTLVLSGGSTPEKAYALLAAAPPAQQLDWSRTYLFFGDERFVPHDDPRSNFAMARRTLLARVAIAPEHVFAVTTTCATPAASAEDYAARLTEFFGTTTNAPPPAFDLVLLGLGDDGHTASLFPGAPALHEQRAWTTWSPPGRLPPPVDRVTLTFPTLNAARYVVFLVAGANKAEIVHEVLQGHASIEQHPAVGVRPAAGKLSWLLDEAAAANLDKSVN